MSKKIFLGVVAASVVIFAACGPTKEAEKPGKQIKPIEVVDNKIIEESITIAGGQTVTLKYKILKPGNGATPKPRQQVTVHYAGWLEKDGKLGIKFDSSVDRGKKFTFTIGVGQVIAGWDRGVMSMKVGEKRRLFIPYQLAYGERGRPGSIPPKSTLIFDVELFEVR